MYKRKEIIGNCTLYLGDCLDIMPTLDKVDCVITDPPYLYLKHKLDRHFDHVEWIKQVYSITKDNASFGFFGRGVSLAQWICEADKVGFKFKEEIIWDKRQTSSPMLSLGRVHELFIVFGKGDFKINKVYIDYIENCFNSEDFNKVSNSLKRVCSELRKIKTIAELQELLSGGFKYNHTAKHGITVFKAKDKNRGFATIEIIERGAVLKSIISQLSEHYQFEHPTQKPVKLMQQLIELSTNKGDTILDSFCGSGSTLVACAKTGRHGIGIEIDEDYFDIACRRVEDAYKQGDLFL
jgi:site-specific DNA-methyltransferase (adenine-specific)